MARAAWSGFRGEHDAFTADDLGETMTQAMALGDGELVIDLSGVEFMGLATVGVIVRASEALGERSRSLALRAPSTRARRVLELCGLSSLLPATVAPGA